MHKPGISDSSMAQRKLRKPGRWDTGGFCLIYPSGWAQSMKRADFFSGQAVRVVTLAMASVLIAAGGDCVALGASRLLTGTALKRQLAQPVHVTWSGMPLRQGLRNLCHAQQVGVLIDRRVDPGQKLELQLDGVPLKAALSEIAGSRRLGVCFFGPLVYFGPAAASSQLRTLAVMCREQVDRLPPTLGRKFLSARPMAWNDFATPRELLGRLARESGFQLRLLGLDRVPHDLWAAAELPSLSLIDRLTLVAIQFGLTFEISPDGRTVTLVPVPAEVGLVRSYPGGRTPKATAQRLAAIVPHAQVKVVGDRVYVTGLLEEHERLSSPGPSPPGPVQGGQPPAALAIERVRVDEVTIEDQPVGGVLQSLAGQLKLELRIDRPALQRAGISLSQRISVHAKNVSVDELLREVIRSTRLKYERRGNVVEIGPSDSKTDE